MQALIEAIKTMLTPGCIACRNYHRPGWMWINMTWMPCWKCNRGERVLTAVKEEKPMALTPFKQAKRPKTPKNYICIKCNTRAWIASPQGCVRAGCDGKVVEQKFIHAKVVPCGAQEKVFLFLNLLQTVDPDWHNPASCAKCGGKIIAAPVLNRDEMFKLAKQCGLKKLKFKKWVTPEVCEGVKT